MQYKLEVVWASPTCEITPQGLGVLMLSHGPPTHSTRRQTMKVSEKSEIASVVQLVLSSASHVFSPNPRRNRLALEAFEAAWVASGMMLVMECPSSL